MRDKYLTKSLSVSAAKIPLARSAVIFGFLLIFFAVVSSALIHGTYSGMKEREAARMPLTLSTQSNNEELHLDDSLYVYTHYVSFPDDSGGTGFRAYIKDRSVAPVPPGISEYPYPGEAAVSLQVARFYPLGTISPWGKVVDIIDSDTLSTPTERYVIAVAHDMPEGFEDFWEECAGFGVSSHIHTDGDSLYVQDFVYVLVLLTLFSLIPGIVILAGGIGASHTLEHRIALLKDLGASRNLLWRYGAYACLKPLAIAASIACVSFTCFIIFPQIRLPIVDEIVIRADAIRAIPWFIVGMLLTSVLGLSAAAFAASYERRPPRFTASIMCKLKLFLPRIARSLVACSGIIIFVLLLRTDIRGLMANNLLVLALAAIFFSVPQVLVRLCGYTYQALKTAFPTPATVVSWAKMTGQRKTIEKLVSVVFISFSLVGVGSVYTAQINSVFEEGAAMLKNLSGKVSSVRCTDSGSISEQLATELREYGGISRLYSSDNLEDRYLVIESQALNSFYKDDAEYNNLVEAAHSLGVPLQHILLSPPDEWMFVECFVINAAANHTQIQALATYRGYSASNYESGMAGSVYLQQNYSNWFSLFTIAICVLLVAGTLSLIMVQTMNELGITELRTCHDWPRRSQLGMIAFSVALPLLMAAASSALSYGLTGFVFAQRSSTYSGPSTDIMLLICAASLAVALSIWAYAVYSTRDRAIEDTY